MSLTQGKQAGSMVNYISWQAETAAITGTVFTVNHAHDPNYFRLISVVNVGSAIMFPAASFTASIIDASTTRVSIVGVGAVASLSLKVVVQVAP